MKMITPTKITDAMLTSSTVPETDHAAWVAGTTYALGAYCLLTSTHRIYKSLQAGNTGHSPDESASTWWLDVGPTNRWACFDNIVSTQTSGGTSMTVVLAPGAINALALINIAATELIVTMTSGATTVYSQTIGLIAPLKMADWYGYFFEPISRKSDVVLLDLPTYANCVITITLTDPSEVLVGNLIVGISATLGLTHAGPKIGITDYSRKETDEFGSTILTQRSYSKYMSVSMMLDSSAVDGVAAALSAVRATPIVWIASEKHSSLVVFGWAGDFEIDLATRYYSHCSLQIKGLI